VGESLQDRIWKDLVKKIASGEFKMGQKLPTEKELQTMYNASRTPVREALRRLVADGFVVRRPGKGTFVTNRGEYSVHARHSPFSFYYARYLDKITAKTIHASKQANPPEDVARALKTKPGQAVTYIERIRKMDQTPVSFLKCWFNEKIPVEPFTTKTEFFRVLDFLAEELGIKCSEGQETVEAVMPDPRERKLLQLPEGVPVLLVRRVWLDWSGDVIAYHKLLANSRIWKYRATVSF